MDIYFQLVGSYPGDNGNHLKQMITGDETSVHHVTSEAKVNFPDLKTFITDS